jgi:penicillin amidase
MKKKLVWLILGLLLVILLAFLIRDCASEKTGVTDFLKWNFSQKSGLPQYSGTILAGVDAPVEIYFDDYGVPHILAQTERDLFYAQGYVHAMERIAQMDMTRRAIAGRLSEVAGPALVESDRFHRTIGFRRAAERSYAVLSGETRRVLEAYSAGVNDYIEQNRKNLPPEFILLNYAPEPWDPVDSLSIAKMMAWSLGGNMQTELYLAALAGEVGMEKAAELFPAYPEGGPSILGRAWTALDSGAALALIGLCEESVFPQGSPGIGSNNWVVSGRLTASGGALLASDMHLGLDLPSIWYMNYLSIPGLSVTGVMFPGIPGVIAGFNDHIAWAVTNLGPDVMDLYRIEFQAGNDSLYRYNDQWLQAEIIEEVIKVRGAADVPLRIRVTRFGPVVSDVIALPAGELPLSLRWTALEATREAEAMLGMTRATNFAEFRAALRNFEAPAQNFVYADVEGNIGYLGNGRFPIRSESHRAAGNGLLPVPGWTGEYEWTGWVPWEEIPGLYNPPSGLIVTANHKAVDDGYPYFLTYEWAHPSRALSILRELEGKDGLTLEQMMAAQASFYNSHAAQAVPLLAEILREAALGGREREALAILEEWGRNPVESADSAGAAIFHTLYACLAENLFAGQVSEALLGRMIGTSAAVLDRLIQAGQSAWYGDRVLLLAQSLHDAAAMLSETLGEDPARWRWGEIHLLTFKHPLGDSVSKTRYNRGPFPVGGSGSTPAAMGYARRLELPFRVGTGAPWRYVVDLADHTAYDILAIGNSGHIRSPHYADLLEMWLGMAYKPRLFRLAEIKKLGRLLVLEPRQ